MNPIFIGILATITVLYLLLRRRLTLWGAPGFARLQQKYGVTAGILLLIFLVACCLAIDGTFFSKVAYEFLLLFIADLCWYYLRLTPDYCRPDRTSEDSDRFLVLLIVQLVTYTVILLILLQITQPYVAQVQGTRFELLFFTILIALPLFLINYLPPWLAWRVVRHLGLPILYRFVFWFTPGIKASDVHYFHLLIQSLKGGDPLETHERIQSGLVLRLRTLLGRNQRPAPMFIDDWTICALALAAEKQGDTDRARTFIRTLFLAPAEVMIHRLLRVFAIEELVWQSISRNDWQEALIRTQLGAGRGMPLLKLIARNHLYGELNRPLLCLTWLISPHRLRALPLMRHALFKRETAKQLGNDHDNPGSGHLYYLAKAANSESVELADIFYLAAKWQSKLDAPTKAQFTSRGLELGCRDVGELAHSLWEEILTGLDEMAAVATGDIPNQVFEQWESWRDTMVGELLLRYRGRLFADVETYADRFNRENEQLPGSLLEECMGWLTLRNAADQLGRQMGDDDFATAWYSCVQSTTWTWASRIHNTYRSQVVWLSIAMFNWVVNRGEIVDDNEAVAANLENLMVCGYRGKSHATSVKPSDVSIFVTSCKDFQTGCLKVAKRLWHEMRQFTVSKLTLIIPVVGTLLLCAVYIALTSFDALLAGVFIGLPIITMIYFLLYLFALRIEKQFIKTAE